MKPAHFPQADTIFKGEDCFDLPGVKVDIDGTQIIISFWELEEGDLEKIKESGGVWFAVWGAQQPPICLRPDSFFNEEAKDGDESSSV